MADITQPSDRRAPTTGELATLPRITRARFIGNAIGALVLLVIVMVIYAAAGYFTGANPMLFTTLTTSTSKLVMASAPVTFVFLLIYLCILVDLAIRRRHDRNRSGVDVVVWAEFAVGVLVLHLFGPDSAKDATVLLLLSHDLSLVLRLFGSDGIVGLVADGMVLLLDLYLLIVLVFLPGTRGPNRYGKDPVELLHRAGH